MLLVLFIYQLNALKCNIANICWIFLKYHRSNLHRKLPWRWRRVSLALNSVVAVVPDEPWQPLRCHEHQQHQQQLPGGRLADHPTTALSHPLSIPTAGCHTLATATTTTTAATAAAHAAVAPTECPATATPATTTATATTPSRWLVVCSSRSGTLVERVAAVNKAFTISK